MATTDKTTTKGDESLAEIGDNSQRDKELFEKALRAQIAMNAKKASINAENTKLRKGFKADGIKLSHLDRTIAMLEWSPSEIREEFAIAQRYAGWIGLPIGQQVDLFVNGSNEEVAKSDWQARGRADALRLKPASVPKGCPPEHHQDYLEGHSAARWWSDDVSAE